MPTDAMIERAHEFYNVEQRRQHETFDSDVFDLMVGFAAAEVEDIEAANRDLRGRLEDIERRLRDAVALRGRAWIIRYEEHGGDGPGYYAMHDLWEGGSIGPYSSIIEADRKMTEALSKIAPVTEAATEPLTKERLAKMTPAEIAGLDWKEVRELLMKR